MDNPSLILQTVDKHLNHKVQLVIYGRAALCLGFDDSPLEAFSQMKPVELVELRDAFAKAKPVVLKLAAEISETC